MISQIEHQETIKEDVFIIKPPAQKTVNSILVTIAILLFVGVMSTYFVKEIPNVIVDIRNISSQALWVFIGGYAIGEIFKKVAINRARTTKEYKEAKEETKKAFEENAKNKRLGYEKEYCEDYSDRHYKAEIRRILKSAMISEEDYYKKYFSLNKFEIKEKYPDNKLSKIQLKTIKKANSVKKIYYNADFLRSVEVANKNVSPSDLYNVQRKNVVNTIVSAITGFFACLFCASFAKDLIFSFSMDVLFEAVVKTIAIITMIAFKTQFGWSLVMETEINRLNLQTQEANNYALWFEEKYSVI